MKKALIVWGGWKWHEPKPLSELFGSLLRAEGMETELSDTLESFSDAVRLRSFDLIIPIWSMGTIEKKWAENVLSAVESGVGLAGCHGGMCDAFRENTDWQFLTGSQWVAHPGNSEVTYRVNLKKNSDSLILKGIDDFDVTSEQYYLHVDPAVHVLATTRFPLSDGPYAANGTVDMPVAYTKRWGAGRVFYCSLGHNARVFAGKDAVRLVRNGLLWAAGLEDQI